MRYKAVIFDLDGTLLNTLDDLAAAVNYAMRTCGYPTHGTDRIRTFIGNGIDILIRRSIPSCCTDEEWLHARDIFKSYYTAHMLDNTRPYKGISDMLEALGAHGIKTAVVTNKNHEMANEMIPRFFGSLIPCVIGTDLTKRRRKPSPDGVAAALEELCVSAEDAVYVGDTEVDVQTAHNSGLKCIGVRWGFRCGDDIEGADLTAETPNELEKMLTLP